MTDRQTDYSTTFIIRKRKKWKFAHFSSYENCFELNQGADAELLKSKLRNFLPKGKPLVLELAAGSGQFAFELARRHPEQNFIAVDIKSDRLYTGAKQALETGQTNIAFLRLQMHGLSEVFDRGSVEEIWLTFPDPFPKKRSAKHRLTYRQFLKIYRGLLTKKGTLKFKTDNRQLFLWSLEQFVGQKWRINELSFDLHESDLPDDYKIPTVYERKFIDLGEKINFCSLSL